VAVQKKRILLIDDQKPFLDVMSAMLTRLRYDSKTVSDCFQALNLLENEVFDLIIVDMVMPQIGGMVFIELIRGQQPMTPILVVSGYCEKLTKTLEVADVDGILPKPIRLAKLRTTLNEIFSKRARLSHQSSQNPARVFPMGRKPSL
jgi:CheY-like chemotaxis protein